MTTVIAEHGAYMRRRGMRERTIELRLRCLRCFEHWAGGDLFSVTHHDIDRFLDSRVSRTGGRIESKTRYGWLSHLHKFYEWAIVNDLTTVDPTVKIDRPKMRQNYPRPMREADVAKALEHADTQMYAWLMLAAYAGFRCMEIAGMTEDWLLRDEGVLHVVWGKGGKERFVPAHPHVVAALDSYGLPRRGAVFNRPLGGRWPATEVSRQGNTFLAGLGINATMHQARHRFATRFYASCHDLRLTQKVMGHSNPSTTALYTAVSDAEARTAVMGLPTFHGRQLSLI